MTINLKDFNVMVVDDDEGLRTTLCNFFADECAHVFCASNGEEALQIALVEKIDLILSDIKMPVMDGIELLKSIHTGEHDTVPLVLLMSGQSDLDLAGALALGAQGLLKKPFKFQTLLEQVEDSLEKNL